MNGSTGSSDLEHTTGSPPDGEPVFLLVGKLRKPHGVHGEIVMEVWTEFPERLEPGGTVYIGDGHKPMIISGLRWHTKYMLVSLKGIFNPEIAGEFRNQWVFVRTDQIPSLDEGEYYHHQIIGLQVFSEHGTSLGVVAEILETGSNDVLVVQSAKGQELLLPVTDEVIIDIDLEGGLIKVHLLPGIVT